MSHRAHETNLDGPDELRAARSARRGEAPGAPHRADLILALQARVGNAAVARLVREGALPGVGANRASIQRQPPAAPPAPATSPGAAAAPAPARWNPPFGLESTDDRPGACAALIDIGRKLQEFKDAGFNETDLVIKRAKTLADELPGADPLTADEAQKLNGFGLMALASHDKALNEMKNLIGAALNQWLGVDMSGAADAAAEKVHAAFMGTASASKLSDAKEMLGKVKEFGDTVSDYVGYAAKAKHVIKSAEKLEKLKEGIDGFVGKVGEAKKLAGLAESIGVLAGKVGQMPGGTQGDIAKFQAAFNIADYVFSKSKVPLVGVWWSEFIKPTAELCLKKVQKLDEIVDKIVRDNEGRIDEWWQQASRGGGPPQIASSPLEAATMSKYFPGGQEMLNFMWNLFRGGVSEVPKGVEQYFIKFKSQFGEGHEEEDQIETEGSTWYKPWTWLEEDRAPKLLNWVTRHKEEVWAMLYGRLPHP